MVIIRLNLQENNMLPEVQKIISGNKSNKNLAHHFNMPAVKPGPAFSSNMPVMGPQSSVQYYILQKRISINKLQPDSKKQKKTTRVNARAASSF